MSDKRTVTTDALETLGTIIGNNEKRDAIHLAVEPVTAGQCLDAGDHIVIAENGYAKKVGIGHGVGIVDPFLTEQVPEGAKFWLVVYPRQISSLRHVWEHPSFPLSGETNVVIRDISKSEQWLKDFCSSNDMPSYNHVMAAIKDEPLGDDLSVDKDDEEYWTFRGTDCHCDIPDEFWNHVEIVLGRKLERDQKTKHFSCSC